MQAKIWNWNKWVENIPTDSEIKESYTELLQRSGFKILDTSEYHFQPIGYTALWLLGESHFAVHTFPEEGRYYIELSSCNESYFKEFIRLFVKNDRTN